MQYVVCLFVCMLKRFTNAARLDVAEKPYYNSQHKVCVRTKTVCEDVCSHTHYFNHLMIIMLLFVSFGPNQAFCNHCWAWMEVLSTVNDRKLNLIFSGKTGLAID